MSSAMDAGVTGPGTTGSGTTRPSAPASSIVGRLTARIARTCTPEQRACTPGQSWGTIRLTSPVRYGWRVYRLTVYAPGTDSTQRRLLWLDRNIPYLSAVLMLALTMVLQPSAPSLSVLLLVPVGIAVTAMVRHPLRELRLSVRTLAVAYVDVDGSTRAVGNSALLDESMSCLREADRALAAEEISRVEHERRWGMVYDGLGDTAVALRDL